MSCHIPPVFFRRVSRAIIVNYSVTNALLPPHPQVFLTPYQSHTYRVLALSSP